MKTSEAFPSTFLAKSDVPQPFTATVRQVIQEEIKGDGGNDLKPVLVFNGNVKKMVLNRGNWNALAETYGDDSNAWTGKAVEVYVDPNVLYAGKRVGGIRLRCGQPQVSYAQPTLHPSPNGAPSEVWTYLRAQVEASKVNISKDQLVAGLKAAGLSGWNDAKCTPVVKRMIADVLVAQQPEQPFDEQGDAYETPPGDIPF